MYWCATRVKYTRIILNNFKDSKLNFGIEKIMEAF